MTEVQIVRVDERDSRWEKYHPRFRVYLHGSGEAATHGWTDTYDITLVDDGTEEAVNREAGRRLIWLLGMDGNTNPIDPYETDTLRRMLSRRREPVIVPPADHMPSGVPDPYNDGTERR